MGVSASAPLDVNDVLVRNALRIHFQPIVSVRQRKIMGVEALCRGQRVCGEIVPPVELFRCAAEQGVTLELDRACRRAAVEQFAPLHRADPHLVLFINTHPSQLADDAVHPHTLVDLVQQHGIDPRNIALEILESEHIDTALLQAAAAAYHRQEILVALDDVGVGYSNLDRIMLVKPDMLKADRALVQDLHHDVYKQGVFKALVYLAERIGGWIITEGVETRDEAVMALELGADMLQGFFFARPQPLADVQALAPTLERAADTAKDFRHYTLAQFTLLQQHKQRRKTIVQQIAAQLADVDPVDLQQQLAACIKPHPMIASAYVLDAAGQQITGVVQPQPLDAQKTIIFEPPAQGSDHSLREYFYLAAHAPDGVFETQPYVPLPAQRLCITASTIFADMQNRLCVLCVHLDVPALPHP